MSLDNFRNTCWTEVQTERPWICSDRVPERAVLERCFDRAPERAVLNGVAGAQPGLEHAEQRRRQSRSFWFAPVVAGPVLGQTAGPRDASDLTWARRSREPCADASEDNAGAAASPGFSQATRAGL